jgi:hypothetical protein
LRRITILFYIQGLSLLQYIFSNVEENMVLNNLLFERIM